MTIRRRALAACIPLAALSPARAEAPRRVEVPITVQDSLLLVKATVNGSVTETFVIDSGATHVTLSLQIFDQIALNGAPAYYIEQRSYTLADGSQHETSLYRLNSLTVGGRTVTNVECLVSTGDAGQQMPVLGQSFLRKFRSWSIDNARNVLVLEW